MFDDLKKKVNDRFMQLAKHDLYVTNVDKDSIFDTYLANIVYDERQTHNCNNCKGFLKNYGSVVAIVNNEVETLWDFEIGEPYSETVKALHNLVKASVIRDAFYSAQSELGVDHNIQLVKNPDTLATTTKRWNHLSVILPSNVLSNSIDAASAIARDTKNVFKRSLDEITQDSVETVLELIAQNSLYRGAEFAPLLNTFLKCKREYSKLDEYHQDLYAWSNRLKVGKLRNFAIGTLLTDISNGVDLNRAVTSFESMVAPANYKRPTSLVTKGMIEDAEKTITDLGLEKALSRRYAVKYDISVNNMLFVDRNVTTARSVFAEMKDDVVVNPKSFSKVETIPVDIFVNDVLPTLTSVEILVENSHEANLVSIIAPSDPDAPSITNWDNSITWDYNGMADSVKAKVKRAGGRVDGELRVSLEWFNYDDLDLHVIEPTGREIWFSSKVSPSSGALDVDMNVGGNGSREAVENVVYTDLISMNDGIYKVDVVNYTKRENIDLGFNVEIECRGETHVYSMATAVVGRVPAVEFKFTRKDGIVDIRSPLKLSESTIAQKTLWGLSTNQFHKVASIMMSPNYWGDNAIGNKHLFFIINNAINPGTARGLYNEMLKPELQKHRKVFEILGNKLKVPEASDQMSGLGFSSTIRNSVVLKVTGKFSRVVRVEF